MTSRVVHLELHTANLGAACAFYSRLLGWRAERVAAADGAYRSPDLGPTLSAGAVECGTDPALWLPYVEVDSVADATTRAVELGATVLLAPCEGPAGWRSMVTTPAGDEIAFWRTKR